MFAFIILITVMVAILPLYCMHFLNMHAQNSLCNGLINIMCAAFQNNNENERRCMYMNITYICTMPKLLSVRLTGFNIGISNDETER